MSDINAQSLAYAFGEPTAAGVIRTTPDDFQVDEVLGFDLDGSGEHVCLHIRKRGLNTADLAQRIAVLAGVKRMDVSYAGLKDRHAVTSQWFSIYLGNKPEPDWQSLVAENIEILAITRHGRKLRRGCLAGNRFTLKVRNLTGDVQHLAERLTRVKADGVPNYFGEQRFGHNNLERAQALFEGRIKVRDKNKRGMYLSAARSQIFNEILSHRVVADSWNTALSGDVMMLAGSNSVFTIDEPDDEIRQRLTSVDIHPTGALWGRGALRSAAEVAALESTVCENYPVYCDGLEKAGLKQERRALRLMAEEMSWQLDGNELTLMFYLGSGSYATSVMRECIKYSVAERD